MSIDQFEFLSSYVDDNVAGYYTKISEFASLAPAGGLGPPVNAFAVICSYTMPKASKGSHKYSVTFSIVDPSITLATSVPFVWFCNNLNNLHMNFKVGDIIRIQGAFLQSFNSYPQLVGKDNCTSVTIFHRKDNFLTGWPSEPLTVVPPVEPIENGEMESEDGRQARAAAAVRLPYIDPAWEVTNLGVADANLGDKMSKKERKALPAPPVDRPPLMWPQEIHKLLFLYDWVDRYFTTHSFADSTQVATQHVTLHAMQMYLHRAANSQAYDALLPAAEPHPDGAYPAVPMQGGASNKCDLVCLVMSVVPASASVDGLARMTVWDGTTNGMYTPSLQLGKAIQVALDAPAVYDSADELAFYQEANRRIETTETSQPAHTQSSHTSANSSAHVLTPLDASTELGAELNALLERDYTSRKYAGSAVKILAAEVGVNQHIMRCKPGMWIRIRNLYALTNNTGASGAGGAGISVTACVKIDSHVCTLSPKYLDVRHLVRSYLNRMTRLLMRQAKSAQPTAAAPVPVPTTSATSSSSSSAAAAMPPPLPPGPPQRFSGELITPIGVMKSGPAPAKYCLRAHIESWRPSNIDGFLTKESNPDGTSVNTIQLALTIADATGSTVVFLHGEEAERYLNTTADILATHPAAREVVQHRLEALRDQKIFSEFKVRVYVDKTTVPLPVPAQPQKRGRPSNNRQQDSQLTYVRKTKRMIGFDTVWGTPATTTSSSATNTAAAV